MVSGLGLRYLAQQAAKAVPFGGDFIAGAIAGAATWSIGEVALEYYESGKRVNSDRLKQLYHDFYQRFRKGKGMKELREASATSLNGKEAAALLGEPKEEILEEGTA
jgi:hypothetical protein